MSIAKIATLSIWSLFVVLAIDSSSAADLTGSWSGDWKSCTSGHKGPLSAQFCRVNAEHYEVRFKGRFFKVIPFRYAVTLQVVEETPDHVTLSGSQNLGRIFGTFEYSATVTGNCFLATYTSCKDDGQFRLTRCTAPCANSTCLPSDLTNEVQVEAPIPTPATP